jgi:L,D-transpeptidase ErfK/SrfK
MKLSFSLLLGVMLLSSGLVWSTSFPMPPEGVDLVGRTFTYQTIYEDTFSDIALVYDIGFRQLKAANPDVDPWLPGEGTEIIIPQHYILPSGPREGVIINLAELRLYYFPKDRNEVDTYPLGIGREGWSTPVGETRIIGKKKDPSWTVPASILKEHKEEGNPLPPMIPPGPDNPLGAYALYLGMSGYLLHGTNRPFGVGMRVSHGCIRLYPENISQLFEQVPVGTPVRIINQPFKAGWFNGELYVEAHHPLSEQIKENGQNQTGLISVVLEQLGDDERTPEWSQLLEFGEQSIGIPMPLYLWDADIAVVNGTEKNPGSLD